MDIFEVPHRHGGAKRSPFLKFVTYILQWWNLSVIPYLKQIQKYTKYVTHPLSFADIRIFFTFVKSRNIGIDFFFLSGFLFHDHSQITELQGKGEGISWTPHYHFQPFHRHLDIGRVITAESLPLHIASSWTRTGNLWFPSASC